MNTNDPAVERGGGNVFADLGLPDADTHLLKAELVGRIDAIVRRRGLTQTEAGRVLGLSQPDVSRLLRGDFREYSLERLLRPPDDARTGYRHRHPATAFGHRRPAAHRRRRACLTPSPITRAAAAHMLRGWWIAATRLRTSAEWRIASVVRTSVAVSLPVRFAARSDRGRSIPRWFQVDL